MHYTCSSKTIALLLYKVGISVLKYKGEQWKEKSEKIMRENNHSRRAKKLKAYFKDHLFLCFFFFHL